MAAEVIWTSAVFLLGIFLLSFTLLDSAFMARLSSSITGWHCFNVFGGIIP